MSSSVCSSSNLPCLWSNSDVASGAKELTCDVPFVLEGERGWTTSSHHEELPLAYWLIGQWCITVPFEPKCHLRLVAYWAPLTAMRKGSTAKSLHSGLSWPKGLGGASCKSRRHALQPYGYFYFDPDLLTSNNFGITIPIVAQMDII